MDPQLDYVTAARDRARRNLDAYRNGTTVPQPAGRFVAPVVLSVIFLLLPGLAGLAGAVAVLANRRSGDEGVAVILAIVAMPFLFAAVWIIVNSKANTPKRALKLYFGSLGGGKLRRAAKLVLRTDFDDFPRYQPFLVGLGTPTPDEYRFETPLSYERYWEKLLRTHPSPYCRVQVGKLKLSNITPDVLVADFRLTVTMNTSLYALLILLGCVGVLAALIIDVVTRKVVKADLRKVLVRVEDEWHLLNGAWWEHDEADLSWLDAR